MHSFSSATIFFLIHIKICENVLRVLDEPDTLVMIVKKEKKIEW